MPEESVLRIGEVSRRCGVSPELLRAWERRYGLLRPTRSPGGLRLYSRADLDRVLAMKRNLDAGLAAAEAARDAAHEPAREAASVASPEELRGELTDALDRFDEPAAQTVLDRLFAAATLETLLGEVILPYLQELGQRWRRGEATVAQEHFASSVLRGRLMGLGRGWGLGVGPLAVLACLPAERHELGLIAFGLALRSRGWRIVYLGADAPLDTVEAACHGLEPSLIVLSGVSAERVEPVADELRALAQRWRIALGGGAASTGLLDPELVLLLSGGLIEDATRVSSLPPAA